MKRRTGSLFSSAVALGLAGGVAGGFAVQYSRPPTPLPPVPHTVAAAVAPAAAEKPDPKTDDGAKLDGDLRELLLDGPADAHDSPLLPARSWVTIGHLAEYFEHPDRALATLNEEGFRRAARTVWVRPDGTQVELDLVQFRSTDGAGQFFSETKDVMNAWTTTPAGTGTGYVAQDTEKTTLGDYVGYGLVQHGTVVEQLFVTRKAGPPELGDLMEITKEQADRL
ncbi:MAG: hypothetical protein HOV87_09960 [Catenulispora sp.]|nr:hypothetical protein [Catenulispora sp.]